MASNSEDLSAPKDATKAPAAKKQSKPRKPRFKKIEHHYPVEPRVIQVVKKPKTYVDHSYRDFSIVPSDVKFQASTSIDDMNFAEKVHDMLHDEHYSEWIQWLPHGRGFHIPVPKRLEQSRVLQKYFGHNRFSSFLRQLNNHGFKHISRGVDRNSYYHECFLRGMKHLLKYMPPGRDARRLMPDPDNEPDLYAISRVCPLHAEGNQLATAETAQQGFGGSGLNSGLNPLQLQGLMNQGVSPNPLPLGLSLQSLQAPQVANGSLQQAASFQQNAMALEHQAAALQRAASLQKAASLQQQMAAMNNDAMQAPNQGIMNQGVMNQGMGSQFLGNQQQQAQLPDDPAFLSLLLRSRGMM